MSEALTDGVHHIGLAVRDLDEAASFFCRVLGFWERGRNDDYPALFMVPTGLALGAVLLLALFFRPPTRGPVAADEQASDQPLTPSVAAPH